MSLITLLLTVLGAIGGAVWLTDQFRRRVQARAFFRLFPSGQEVLIVVPSLGQSGPNITMTFEDALACATVQTAFVKHGHPYRVKIHTQITPDDRAANLFILGGEVVNTLMAEAGKRGILPIRAAPTETGTRLRDTEGNELHPAIRPGATDYAIIAVLKNPWSHDHEKRLYIAAGAEGIGTWAAATELTSNVQMLSKRLRAHDVSTKRHFEAVLTVRVSGYQVPRSLVTQAVELP